MNAGNTSLSDRLKILFIIIALSVCVYAAIEIMGISFLENIDKLSNGNIAVALSYWDIPVFLSLPCFVALIIALVFRFAKQLSEKWISAAVNVAIMFALLAIVVRIPYGHFLSHYMQDKGYSSCWAFTSPSITSEIVWVRNPGYCIENTSVVRSELLAWIDSLPDAGKDVPPMEVRLKAEELLSEYDRQQREKYPDLYY